MPFACTDQVCTPIVRDEWSCFGEEVSAPADAPNELRYTAGLVDAIASRPLSGVSAKACNALDAECAEPVGDSTTSNADGVISVPLTRGFTGYIQLEQERLTPALLIVEDLNEENNRNDVPISTPAIWAAQAAVSGVALNPDLGRILFRALDCDGARASGIAVDVEPKNTDTARFYFIDGQPDFNASVTQGGPASVSTGSGGIINVPPGVARVSFTRDDIGEEIESFSVTVRPGFVTLVYAGPTSRDPIVPEEP